MNRGLTALIKQRRRGLRGGIIAIAVLLLCGGCNPPPENLWQISRRTDSQPPVGQKSPHQAAVSRAAFGRKAMPRIAHQPAHSPSYQTVDGPSTDSHFGHTVAGGGDVNGDGFDDVLVGAFAAPEDRGGEVFLYYGSPEGIGPKPNWSYHCPVPRSEFGHQVEGVGDVNGDGFSDFIVGATYYSGKTNRGGGAFVFLGSKDGPGSQPDWEMSGGQEESRLGFTVAAAGDVNGDGYDDVLVGAFSESALDRSRTESSHGRVYLFLGSVRGLSKESAWSPTGEQAHAKYAYTVHGAGDVNGDGCADVVVGSWGYEAERPNAGRVYVYYGGPSGPSREPDWTMTGTQSDQFLGNSVFTAGDVNGDGFDDLIVAANMTDHGEHDEGTVFVFYGSAHGLPDRPSWSFEPDRANFYLGHSVATAGDVDGDGFADVIVSAFNGHQQLPDEGVVLLFHGSRNGLANEPSWSFHGAQTGSGYGATVRCAGDVNGDGFGDVVVGQTFYSGSIPRQGRAWVHYGSLHGLRDSTHWGAPAVSMGFSYKKVLVPWPNLEWAILISSLSLGAIFVSTRRYYRQRLVAALALQKAQSEAQLEERRRISQDLHDTVGAELTAIGLLAETLQPSAPADRSQQVQQLRAITQHAVESLREVVWEVEPGNDTLERMAGHLGDLASTMAHQAGKRCLLQIPADLPDQVIPSKLRHDLALAVKEALHNAIKHSQAGEIGLRIQITSQSLLIELSDNGRGFQINGPRPSGKGLANMRSRVETHGGEIEVRTSPEGTHIRLLIPLPLSAIT